MTGKTEVVDTTSGDATASDLKLNKAAWVDGEEVTGTLTGGTELKTGGSFSPSGRWYDNNDGTITDTTTGLVWLKNIGWGIQVPFDFYCPACIFEQGDPGYDVFNTLYTLRDGVGGLTDGSVAGDWGPPTKAELQGLMAGAEPVSYGNQGLFTGIVNDVYWTTTPGASVVWQVFVVDLADTNLATNVSSRVKTFVSGAAQKASIFPVRRKH